MPSGLLALAVLLCCLAFGTAGADEADQTLVSVVWTNVQTGETSEYMAQQITAGGDAYWAYLPSVAFEGVLTLRVFDYSGRYASFDPGDGAVLSEAADAGPGTENAPSTEIRCLDAAGAVLSVKKLYLSSFPVPAVQAADAQVRVVFRDSVTGMELCESQALSCAPLTVVPVYAQTVPGYTLVGEDVQYVTTDAAGNASPAEVIFTYAPSAQPVVTVYYLDPEGRPVLEQEQIPCPLNDVVTVTARPVEGYRIEDGQAVDIYVDQNGNMSRNEVVFRYKRVEDAVISVRCVDESTGLEIAPAEQRTCAPGETAVLYAADIPGYKVTGESVQTVTADMNGAAYPSSVTFTYLPVRPAVVSVRAVDAETGADLSVPRQQTCEPGSTVIFYAESVKGFVTDGPKQVTVFIGADGVPDRDEVVFSYVRIREPVVSVRFVNALTGEPLAADTAVVCAIGETTLIESEPIAGYRTVEDSSVQVTVDEFGTADRYEVVFRYAAISDPVVTVRYLSASVLQQELLPSETIACPLGRTTQIRAKKIDGYLLDGDDTVEVTVGAQGETDTDTVTFYYNAVQAPVVTVRYLLDDGTEIAEPDMITCPVNQTSLISAENIAGFTAAGETVKTVNVDVNGIADANEIVFLYRRIGDALVRVRYIDAQNNVEILQSSQAVCHLGANTRINAAEIEGYTVVGQNYKHVYVDEYGKADAAEIVFTYEKAKAPGAVLVPVTYRDQTTGIELFTSHELFETDSVNYVSADRSVIPEDFEVAGPAEQEVIVDQNGVPDPPEIVFLVKETTQIEAGIPVYYRSTEGEEVASPTWYDCVPGNNAVTASPVDLREHYSLLDGDTQYVFMETDGTLSAEEVVFVYFLSVTPAPTAEPTAVPYAVDPQDFYARPSKNGTYFRSSPDTTSLGNVLTELPDSEVIHVIGRLSNERGEYWYLVEAAGTVGFMNANVIQPMAQEEVNRLFGYTPTPVPTEIPDGATIDRWGQINSREVALRSQPSTDGKIIDRISSPAKIWVYQSVTEKNTPWYQVRYNGSDGYMMKKFITLMGETESLQYQASLSTPMATKTPPVTRMPTSVVSPSPTPGPTVTAYYTPSPSPSPTAEPYSGYALTRGQTYLYSGQSSADDALISIEGGDQLVLSHSQTYVDGVCWDSVEMVAGGRMGFAPDTAFVHINNDIARNYLNSMPSSEPTPVPTDVPAQYNGYGITIGEHAVIRAYADTNAQIYNVLDKDTVVMVTGQEYSEGQAWDVVNYGSQWGYIREDQIRMLNSLEVEGYLASLRTPTPLPQATPTAVVFGGSSLSSYGYVTASRVNLRSAPTQTSSSIRMLEKYAFALVMETTGNENGEIWYHVSQAGTEGYIRSDYFTVMTKDELSAFLTGENYSLSGSNEGYTANVSVNSLQAYEDYNASVWKNPAISVSYEPFTVKTPEPEITYLPTAAVTASPSPTPMSTAGIGGWMNTDTPPAPNTMTPVTPQPEKEKGGSSTLGIALMLGAVVFAGGGVYLYSIHRRNERRRRAFREQQARKNAGNDQYRQRPAARDRAEEAPSPYTRTYPEREAQSAAKPAYNPEIGGLDARSGAVPQGTIRVDRNSRAARTGQAAEPAPGSASYREETINGMTAAWRKPAQARPNGEPAGQDEPRADQATSVISGHRALRRSAYSSDSADAVPEEDLMATKGPTKKIPPIRTAVYPPAGTDNETPAAEQTDADGVPASGAAQAPVRRRRSDRHHAENRDEG